MTWYSDYVTLPTSRQVIGMLAIICFDKGSSGEKASLAVKHVVSLLTKSGYTAMFCGDLVTHVYYLKKFELRVTRLIWIISVLFIIIFISPLLGVGILANTTLLPVQCKPHPLVSHWASGLPRLWPPLRHQILVNYPANRHLSLRHLCDGVTSMGMWSSLWATRISFKIPFVSSQVPDP